MPAFCSKPRVSERGAEQLNQHVAQIVGREPELAGLDSFLDSEPPGGALVLVGGPGAGKTTLWESGVDRCVRRRLRVLSARPSGADAKLSFAGLIDLLDGIDFADVDGLPPPQRRALEAALLREDPDGAPAETHAIRIAFLNVLRGLAQRDAIVVAVDDLQWLDASSADALAFAARRLDGSAAFLLARRPGPASPLERALEDAIATIPVGPLSFGAIRSMLSERLGLTLQRQVLRRVVETTLGNPLFALELGRSFLERGIPMSVDEIAVPEEVEAVLGSRVARLPAPLRGLLLAVALSGDPRVSELALIGGASAIDDAVARGLLIVDGDRVRAAHPLLPATARSRARPRERREMHERLAGAVGDSELRALHLALATEQPDAALADTVGAAAAAAAARGATQEAVVLAEHALRITEPGSVERVERLLLLAGYLQVAGELQRVSDLLVPELASLPAGASRVRALVLLSDGGANENNDDCIRYLEQALAESEGAPLERAAVLAKLASNWAAVRVERIPAAEAWAAEAAAAARDGNPGLERLALESLSWARSLRGRPVDDLCDRFLSISDAAFHLAVTPERVAAQRLMWRGEIGPARALLEPMLRLADERGEQVSFALLRFHLCEVEIRAGGFRAASLLLDEWAESVDDELLLWPMYERCRALLAVGVGSAVEAERWCDAAVEKADATGVRWDRLEAMRAAGIAELLMTEPARAVDDLLAVYDHTRDQGVDEPGAFPVVPDLVEALVELGDVDAAAAITARLRVLGEEQDHPWARATARRCASLIGLASGDYDDLDAANLEQAATEYAGLGLAFDHARSLLSLGRARRRARKWGAARDSLERASSVFDAIGSSGWGDRARSELSRVGARKPSARGELTPTEQRVAALATQGLSNKEIAQTLCVTVNTVEAHLSHAYAKLGIRSRAQIARAFAEHP
jgi:DNA-binding NarL/FixJ family response regulator